MKKVFFLLPLLAICVVILSNCHPSKKVAVIAPPEPTKVTFAGQLRPIIIANCSPCHVPKDSTVKEGFDKYANVTPEINDILRRIQLQPEERGFMPKNHPKLSDSTIAVFKQWKEDGLLEK